MWVLETFYFQNFRQSYDTRVTNEAFLREGRLGKILLNNSMVSISEESHDRAIQDDCAESGDLGYGDFQNQFKIRAEITASTPTSIAITAIIGTPGENTVYRADHITDPNRSFYDLNYKAAPGEAVYIKYTAGSNTTAHVINVEVQGRFTTLSKVILKDGIAIDTKLSSINTKEVFEDPTGPNIEMAGKNPEITQYLPSKFRQSLYSTDLARRNSAFCTYIGRPFDVKGKRMVKYDSPRLLPRINITTEENNLYGDTGILDNKHGKGRWWEKPALLSVSNQQSISNQKVSIRFHGGTPGRKKNIESFRIYARKRFGVPTIKAAAITGKPAETDFKTLVLKYTFQSLRTRDIDFNPFIHSLALDIADQIGASVPRHHLANLTVNKQPKGLYLAMEHLSDRTIANWLGNDDFLTFTYKSTNSLEQSVPLFSFAKTILSTQGEDTLNQLKQTMDLNNVINSILTTAYIGDDDYCQGVELITEKKKVKHITSINWDLDHAFFSYKDEQPYINPDKFGFYPIKTRKKTLCVKQWIYGWTYLQSEKFRKLVRARMEDVLETVLSPYNAIKLLDYYKALDQAEFSSRYATPISELEDFLRQRAGILRQQLSDMERKAALVDITENLEGW